MEQSKPPLHLLKVTTRAYKRISAKGVTINTDGTLTEICGANGAGKSSFIDSVSVLLGGKKFADPQPIHDGENTAVIEGDLGHLGKPEYHLRRTITRVQKSGKPDSFRFHLEVTTPDGAVIQNGDELIAEWLGDADLSFDPMACMRLTPAAQVAKVQGMVPLKDADGQPFDLDHWQDEHKKLELNRRDANRDLKQLEGALENQAHYPEVGIDAVNTAELTERLDQINQQRMAYDQAGRDIQAAKNKVNEILDVERPDLLMKIGTAKKQIEQLEARIDQWKADADALERKAGELQQATSAQEAEYRKATPPSADEIRVQLSNAQETNEQVMANRRYAELEQQIEQQREVHTQLDEQYKGHEKSRRDAISRAEYPDGVSIELDHLGKPYVAYEGRPISQASQSEQIRIWIGIAMRGDQRIRNVLIREASLCDQQTMLILKQALEEHDCTAYTEIVGEGRIMIVDGELAEPTDEDDVLGPEMAMFTDVSEEGAE